jgi:hypothetical protein
LVVISILVLVLQHSHAFQVCSNVDFLSVVEVLWTRRTPGFIPNPAIAKI